MRDSHQETLNIPPSALFDGIAPADINTLLGCLGPDFRTYGKGRLIFDAGEHADSIALLVSGRVQLFVDDIFGNRSIYADILEGDLFADAAPFTSSQTLPVSALAMTDCQVVFIHKDRILKMCSSCCSYHTRIIHNLLQTISEKNFLLNEKAEHISKRTIRSKVLSYLNHMRLKTGRREFDIPFNRQELADYLCVDRSALSAELGRLKRENILDFDRQRFKLFA